MKMYNLSQLLYCLSHLKEGILQQKIVLVLFVTAKTIPFDTISFYKRCFFSAQG